MRGARVLVAGGCGGIGRSLVRSLLDAGVDVAIFDMQSSASRHPPPAEAKLFILDASQVDQVDAAFTQLDKHWP
jgi:nucleoside-diphosphate-sugar epimerase